MRRVALLVTLGATIALAYSVWEPTVTGRRRAAAPAADAGATEATLAKLNAELTKLESRTAATEVLTPPARDPFRFNAPVARPVAAPPPTPAPVVAPAGPALPKLIAITSKTTPDGVVRTAALSMGDSVLLAHPGDTVGALVVHAISDGFVELVDPSSGAAYRVR